MKATSRSERRKPDKSAAAREADPATTSRKPDGYIETADASGKPDMMAFWLPDGVSVDDLRLARAI